MGVRVMWPPDIDDDKLVICIDKTRELFDKYQEEIPTKGNAVNLFQLFITV